MAEQHFFIRGTYYGSWPVKPRVVHGHYALPFGKAFFCPACGEQWAFAPVSNEETYVEHILCEKHEPTPSRPTPGCLYLSWDEDWNKNLPKEILARDFLIMYQLQRINDE